MNAAHNVTAYLITSLQFIVLFLLWWPKKSGQCGVMRIKRGGLAMRIMSVNRTLVLPLPLVGLRLMGQRVVRYGRFAGKYPSKSLERSGPNQPAKPTAPFARQ